MAAIHWRCFHCGEGFSLNEEPEARLHFGEFQGSLPACQLFSIGRHSFLPVLRKLEKELARYREEDSEIIRAAARSEIYFAQALRRAEEDGFGRGVRDTLKMLRPTCGGWGPSRPCGSPVHHGYTRCPSCDATYAPAAIMYAEYLHNAQTNPAKANQGVAASGERDVRDTPGTVG